MSSSSLPAKPALILLYDEEGQQAAVGNVELAQRWTVQSIMTSTGNLLAAPAGHAPVVWLHNLRRGSQATLPLNSTWDSHFILHIRPATDPGDGDVPGARERTLVCTPGSGGMISGPPTSMTFTDTNQPLLALLPREMHALDSVALSVERAVRNGMRDLFAAVALSDDLAKLNTAVRTQQKNAPIASTINIVEQMTGGGKMAGTVGVTSIAFDGADSARAIEFAKGAESTGAGGNVFVDVRISVLQQGAKNQAIRDAASDTKHCKIRVVLVVAKGPPEVDAVRTLLLPNVQPIYEATDGIIRSATLAVLHRISMHQTYVGSTNTDTIQKLLAAIRTNPLANETAVGLIR